MKAWDIFLKNLGKIKMDSYSASKFPYPEGMNAWIILSHFFFFVHGLGFRHHPGGAGGGCGPGGPLGGAAWAVGG